MPGMSDFPYDQCVQRTLENARDVGRNDNTASRQPHDQVHFHRSIEQMLPQLISRIAPGGEFHTTYYSTVEVLQVTCCRLQVFSPHTFHYPHGLLTAKRQV